MDRANVAAPPEPPRGARQPIAVWVLLALAALWCLALVGGTFWFAASTSETCVSTSASSHLVCTTTHRTEFQSGGPAVLLVVAAPLLMVAVVAGALALRARHHRRGAGPVAWTVAGALCVVTLLGVFTLGLLLAPIAALVMLACALSAPGATPAGPRWPPPAARAPSAPPPIFGPPRAPLGLPAAGAPPTGRPDPAAPESWAPRS